MPYPPYRGDKLKIFNLAKQLAPFHRLHLLTVAESHEDIAYGEQLKKMTLDNGLPLFERIDWVYRPKLKSYGAALLGLLGNRPLQLAFFRSRAFQKRLNFFLGESYDAIHVQHLRMGQYFDGSVPANAVLDLPDAFSLYWKRRRDQARNPLLKWFNGMEYRRMKIWEQRLLPQFALNLVCSHEDRAYLQENCGLAQGQLNMLPNGVDTDAFAPQSVDSPRAQVLFTGNMDYAPNVDAVAWFAAEIWPEVLKQVPHAKWIIAGQRPVASVRALESESIQVLGFVPHLADAYAHAQVVISPLRLGAGTQNKVLEAMSMAKAVVSSEVGFYGLGIESGQGVVLAKTAAEIAKATVALLQNPDQAVDIGQKGYELVQSRFAWRVVAKQLENYLQGIRRD